MAWPSRLWNTLRGRSLDRELDEELRHHLDLRARDFESAGMTPAAARQQAARQFGNITLQREVTREMDVSQWMEMTLKDIRYALRQFARSPGFTAVAVLSLTLGIGANTAVFSILDAALFRELPVPNPNQIVMLTDPGSLGVTIGLQGGVRALLTWPEFVQLRDRTTVLSGLCASESSLDQSLVRIADGPREEARGRLVSENYFSVLGVHPAIGRFFTENEATGPGSDPYAVISYDYWQRRFAGSATVLGAQIHMAEAALTVVGVAAAGFHGETVGQDPDLWVPMMMQPQLMPGREWLHEDMAKSLDKVMWLHAFGRLKPGVSIAGAGAELKLLFRNVLESGYPASLPGTSRKEFLNQSLAVNSARTGAFSGRDEFARQMLILLAITGLALLIACANIANLLLARAAARSREVGIRLSIGAAKGRLIRQFLTESLLLALIGGVAGMLVAIAGSRLLVVLFSPPDDPLALAPSLDLRVFGFTAGVIILTGLLFGLMPALRATRIDVGEILKETSRTATGSARRLTLAKALVIAQVSMSLLVVSGAGLFLRTLWNLQSVDLGYEKDHLLMVRIDGLAAGYKDTRLLNLYQELTDRIRSLPGVRGVAYSANGLFSDHDSGDRIEVEGFTPHRDEERGSRWDEIGPHYFSTIGIPILLGREIGPQDNVAAPRVCVINEAFRKRFFAGVNPIGRHVTDVYGEERWTMEVVGVVRDVRDHALRDPVPPRFYPAINRPMDKVRGAVNFEVRTIGDSRRLLNAVRGAVLAVNPEIQLRDVHPLTELVDAQNVRPRLIARLCTGFGVVALLLAATGLYGVLSYGIARRTSEIGIRMALGASRLRVIRMVIEETGLMVVAGLIVGMLATAAGTRFVATQLYGLTALDPATIAVAILTLAAVALASCLIPAARASRVNPMTALRHE